MIIVYTGLTCAHLLIHTILELAMYVCMLFLLSRMCEVSRTNVIQLTIEARPHLGQVDELMQEAGGRVSQLVTNGGGLPRAV